MESFLKLNNVSPNLLRNYSEESSSHFSLFMNSLALVLLIVMNVTLVGCVATSSSSDGANETASRPHTWQEAQQWISQGRSAEAEEMIILPLIAEFEGIKREKAERIYCSRSTAETLMYLVLSAGKNESSVVLDIKYAMAFYLYGYILVERGDLDLARAMIEEAISLSPQNSIFLSELGHIDQIEKRWKESLVVYDRAIDASSIAPEGLEKMERGRALRGKGYSLIEMGDYEAAEEVYRECLRIDPEDKRAENELSYISRVREGSP